jgi:hypothetical protein
MHSHIARSSRFTGRTTSLSTTITTSRSRNRQNRLQKGRKKKREKTEKKRRYTDATKWKKRNVKMAKRMPTRVRRRRRRRRKGEESDLGLLHLYRDAAAAPALFFLSRPVRL